MCAGNANSACQEKQINVPLAPPENHVSTPANSVNIFRNWNGHADSCQERRVSAFTLWHHCCLTLCGYQLLKTAHNGANDAWQESLPDVAEGDARPKHHIYPIVMCTFFVLPENADAKPKHHLKQCPRCHHYHWKRSVSTKVFFMQFNDGTTLLLLQKARNLHSKVARLQ